MHLLPAARLTGLRAVVWVIVKVHQRVECGVHLEIDAAASAAVAAIWSA
jgi:hypothetical protein